MAKVPNVNDLLDGQMTLDLECLDRIYLNSYVPDCQYGRKGRHETSTPALAMTSYTRSRCGPVSRWTYSMPSRWSNSC